ncbi:SSI family serine proteinase inhibitor [Amycolatopsis aidingensis]|uniref:SSI family serine proteinase inhibitor n=1 Tax=Amycolatopsis aidingensis TaxID=2842453 RepID=UPI001C0C644A|nr:SSI family serine proteinase inhibitor [Amycolatopsis aidingensis]
MALFPIEPLAACALTLACIGGPDTHAGSEFTLTTETADGERSSVTLECQPSGGTHPEPALACRSLALVWGDFESLDDHPTRQVCTLELAPVQAEAHGHWRGEPVAFSTTYSNPCVAHAMSRGVFQP